MMISGVVCYLLTPWCRVLLEQLTGLQLRKKFPAFHGTRRFITALTSVSHMSLSWASPIQSIYPHHTSWVYILILSTHLRLGHPSGLFPHQDPIHPPLLTHTRHMRLVGLHYIIVSFLLMFRDRCSTVVKVLCYKSEGLWFDSGWCHWNFSLT